MWIEHVPGERRRIRVAGSEQRVFLQRRTAAAGSIKNGGIVRERRDVFAYEFARARLQAGVLMQCTAAVLLRRRAHNKTAEIEECLDRIQRYVIANLAHAPSEKQHAKRRE